MFCDENPRTPRLKPDPRTRPAALLVAIRESIRLDSALDQALISILLVFAQMEREATGERTRESIRHIRESGYHFGKISYGKKAIPAPDNAAGTAPPQGERWSKSTLYNLKLRLSWVSTRPHNERPHTDQELKQRLLELRGRIEVMHLSTVVLGMSAPSCQPTDSCFAAGTRIATPDGEVPIERIVVGQQVWSYDHATDRRCTRSRTVLPSKSRALRSPCSGVAPGEPGSSAPHPLSAAHRSSTDPKSKPRCVDTDGRMKKDS
ncbi:MAG: Hint domain-containing protein [Polyangia bacterium]